MSIQDKADQIRRLYLHPEHFGKLLNFTHEGENVNMSCGDEVHYYIQIENDVIKDISFTGSGCSLCIATASLLASALIGAPATKISSLSPADVLALTGVDSGSKRETCCLISYNALLNAVKSDRYGET